MPKLATPIHVWLDGATEPLQVTSDQRDLAQWEACKDYTPAGRHLQLRFVAWSALKRSGQYTGTWQRFNTVECLEAESLLTDDGAEDEQGLDPGNQATPVTD